MIELEALPGRPAYKVFFEIEGLPKRTNNNGGHWRDRYAEAMKWKNLVLRTVRLKGFLRPNQPLAKARLTLTRYSSRQPDFDGLVSSWKHVIDGLIYAGILENDKMENIGMPEFRWKMAPAGKGKITVEVEEVVE